MPSTLYISDPECALRKRSDRLVVEQEGVEIAEIRCDLIDTVILLGPIEFSTAVVFELAYHNIEMAICTQSGKIIAQLTPPHPANIDRVLKQYDLFRDAAWTLASAKNVIQAKLNGCNDLLEDASRNLESEPLRLAISEMNDFASRVPDATEMASLLGVEGSAGARWFSLFGLLLKDRTFTGRSRRPPVDPVNALLSLGYSLVTTELNGLIDAVGLNPSFGFLHKPEYGRPSLALDLLEEFRAPLVDRFVVKVFNLKQFSDSDFEARDGGCYLTRDSFKRFLKEWERYQLADFNLAWGVRTWNEAFRAAVGRLRECIDDGTPYLPIPLDQ